MTDRKRGEADHIARQSRIGTTRTDAQGRVWRKVRRLTRDEYETALLDAEFDARFGKMTDAHARALGWEVNDEH